MLIRDFATGDEVALHAVFVSALRDIACNDYTAAQIAAWESSAQDPDVWRQRIQVIRPYVVELAGRPVAYADLQPDGYIDHFFVAGPHARAGIGSRLMSHIQQAARCRGIGRLTSDVSRTAQPFYARFGFVVLEHRTPVIAGITVPNALMACDLTADGFGSHSPEHQCVSTR